jgi:hypothetical protein
VPDNAEAAPPGAPPETARTVAGAEADETDAPELVRLQLALEAERGGRKRDQVRVAELEDELHRLKAAPRPPAAPEPEPVTDDDWFRQLGRLF